MIVHLLKENDTFWLFLYMENMLCIIQKPKILWISYKLGYVVVYNNNALNNIWF